MDYDYEGEGPDWSWAAEFIGPDGQLDEDAFMEALQKNPELMAQFQGKYCI